MSQKYKYLRLERKKKICFSISYIKWSCLSQKKFLLKISKNFFVFLTAGDPREAEQFKLANALVASREQAISVVDSPS